MKKTSQAIIRNLSQKEVKALLEEKPEMAELVTLAEIPEEDNPPKGAFLLCGKRRGCHFVGTVTALDGEAGDKKQAERRKSTKPA